MRFIALGTLLLACCSGKAASADFLTAVLSQGPVGYWRLNETTQPPPAGPATNLGSLGAAGDGEYLFNPKRGQPGALIGTAVTSARFSNPNLDVAYGGSKVEVPFNTNLNPTGPFSVEFWAKPTSVVTDVFCPVASIDSDPALGVGTNANPRPGWLFYQFGTNGVPTNQWQFRLGNASNYLDAGVIRGGTVTTGAWHHIVGTFDGSNATLYVNGVRVSSRAISGYQPNGARPFRIGTTSFEGLLGPNAGNRGFDGWLEEVAFYGSVLSPNEIAAHYAAATTNGAGYASMVLAKNPIGYWRLNEPGNPPAVNLGTLGSNGNGEYVYSASPGQPGPQPPAFSGFESTNRACGFAGTNGFVDLPALNLNTNTVTITAWILAKAIQTNNAGIVFCRAGTTVAGLKFDVNDPNGLSYDWNNDSAAYNFKSSLIVPVSQWCFVGLIVEPDQATLCLQDGTRFATAINYAVHPDQAFEGDTLIGMDIQDSTLAFNGTIDEVAIFNRALSVGEVYSQYASAVGGLKPSIFADLPATETIYTGETLTLRVDAGGTPPLSYQWRKNHAPISGATSNTFTKTNATAADAGTYDVVISNAQGPPVTSQEADVTVQPLSEPAITQNPQGRTVYQGGLLSLTVEASGGGLLYQWQKNGTNLLGATNAAYSVANVSSNDSGAYQVTVSNRVGKAQSAVATVTVQVPRPDSYAEVIIRDGPESWWRLDDPAGSTTLTDAMGRHDGIYKRGVTLAVPGGLAGDTNIAASFDGSSGYAEVPFTKALNTTNFTVECWVKARPTPVALSALSSFTQPPGRGYLIEKSSDGVFHYIFGDGVTSFVFVLTGSDAIYSEWVHLAITYDGVTFTGYLNGRLDGAADVGLVPNNVAPFRIGFDKTGSGWNDYWNGDIDDVAFYQKALTEGQIAAHYASGHFASPSKPVFTKQPEPSTSSTAGAFVVFLPVVDGTPPIRFQWTKNGAPLPDKTNYFLVFNNLSFQDTGIYELRATNALGSATSAPAALAVLPPPAFANVTNGLVLHLTFDGNYQDSSGRTNHAQPVGSPTFVTGAVGAQAMHYRTTVDTSDPNAPVVTAASYAKLGTPPDLQFGSNINFSVSYWVRFTNASGDLPFFCNAVNSFSNPGYTFAPSYKLGGWSWSLGDVVSGDFVGIYGDDSSINDGSWHHLAHTFDRAGSGITYLDGNQVDSRSVIGAGDLDSEELTAIGQDPSGAYPEAGEADIDDLAVWRRVLTAFEVYTIYATGQAGKSFDTYGPVALMVTLDAGTIQLVWQAGTLLQADDLRGPWSAVPGAAPPFYQVTPSASRKFYRVQLIGPASGVETVGAM